MTEFIHPNEFKTRIVLANGSKLLREMLQRIFWQVPDFEVVGFVPDLAGLERLLSSTEADWLVVAAGDENGVSHAMNAVRTRYHTVRILVIAADGSEVLIHRMKSQEIHLEKTSLAELIALMREDVRPAC